MRPIPPLLLALLLLGCDSTGIGTGGPGGSHYLETQYMVEYMGMADTRTRVGTLSGSGSSDFFGYCRAVQSGDARNIDILVADPATWPTPSWMIMFSGLQWIDGSIRAVTCDHVEIFDETVGSDHVPCGTGMVSTCHVLVSRNPDLDHTVQVWFDCNEFETNVSTGGVPNRMSISSGAMQIQNCGEF